MSRRNLTLTAFVLGVVTTPICLQLFQSPWRELIPTVVAEDEVLIDDVSSRPTLDLIGKDLTETRKADDEIPDNQSAPVFNLQLDPNDPRRQTFLELARKKSQLMLPDELDQEIQQLQAELTELEATKQFRSIEWQLEKLIEQFPQSQSAARARQMLHARNLPDDRVIPRRRQQREQLSPAPDTFQRRPSDDDEQR